MTTPPPSSHAMPSLSIVIPTYNERDNLRPLIAKLCTTLDGLVWEAIVVDDDSPDGTSTLARAIAREEPRVRCLRRLHRRGLAGACIEGMLAASSDVVAVMDADLQHDETILPAMLARIADGAAIVVGSRAAPGGCADTGFGRQRAALSAAGSYATRLVIGTSVKDVMSGFFMLRRDLVDDLAPVLATSGFKILADILAHAPAASRVEEVPYRFSPRLAGRSKLDAGVALDLVALLVHQVSRGLVPLRFVSFAMVGSLGLVVHMTTLRLLLGESSWPFQIDQVVASLVAMASNFLLNNFLTYRDTKLRGPRLFYGALLFYLVCSIGALSNLAVADWLYGRGLGWMLAGAAGAVSGAISNFALSSTYVWPLLRARLPPAQSRRVRCPLFGLLRGAI